MAIIYILVGAVAGIFGGLFGIGGATIIIPALIYLGKMTQHQAQGTVLAAMLAPIGILAVMKYYQSGNVKIGIAVFIAVGFIVGAYLGAALADKVSDPLLKKIFGAFLMIIAVNMIFGK